jgi:hypothetical protein
MHRFFSAAPSCAADEATVVLLLEVLCHQLAALTTPLPLPVATAAATALQRLADQTASALLKPLLLVLDRAPELQAIGPHPVLDVGHLYVQCLVR